MKPVFNIRNEHADEEDLSQCRLLMEVSSSSFSYVLLNLRGMRPVVIKFFQWNQFKTEQLEAALKEIIYDDEYLAINPNETFLVYNFPESSLVPERLFSLDSNKQLTDLIYGNLNKNLVLSEKIPWWEFHNVYRIPTETHRLLQQKFSAGRYWHFYSLQLKCHKMFTAKEEQEYLKVIFYPDRIILLAFKSGKLFLVQNFPYQDSKDVVYHLLNCCHQLGLNQEETFVELSGLVERDSSLFEELQKYFLHLRFEGVEDSIKMTDELKEYPQHYFSSLLKMALCV
ncbi:MAG: DUF3822 family protein [Chitinophagales bacterium]